MLCLLTPRTVDVGRAVAINAPCRKIPWHFDRTSVLVCNCSSMNPFTSYSSRRSRFASHASYLLANNPKKKPHRLGLLRKTQSLVPEGRRTSQQDRQVRTNPCQNESGRNSHNFTSLSGLFKRVERKDEHPCYPSENSLRKQLLYLCIQMGNQKRAGQDFFGEITTPLTLQ